MKMNPLLQLLNLLAFVVITTITAITTAAQTLVKTEHKKDNSEQNIVQTPNVGDTAYNRHLKAQ